MGNIDYVCNSSALNLVASLNERRVKLKRDCNITLKVINIVEKEGTFYAFFTEESHD